jgi:hypothetical protein
VNQSEQLQVSEHKPVLQVPDLRYDTIGAIPGAAIATVTKRGEIKKQCSGIVPGPLLIACQLKVFVIHRHISSVPAVKSVPF